MTNSSEALMLKALLKIARESTEDWVIDLTSTVVAEVELRSAGQSFIWNYRGSHLIQAILETPWNPGLSNAEAKKILEIYQEKASSVDDALDINCITVKDLGKDLYKAASVRQKAEWSILKTINQALSTPGIHAKSRVEMIYNAAKYISSDCWYEMAVGDFV